MQGPTYFPNQAYSTTTLAEFLRYTQYSNVREKEKVNLTFWHFHEGDDDLMEKRDTLRSRKRS